MSATDTMLVAQQEMMQEQMLAMGITDDSDALAETCLRLSVFYQEADVDKFLDMPFSRLPQMVKAADDAVKAMKGGGE